MRATTRTALAAVCLGVLSAPDAAHAAVYRCVLDGGHVSYQQIPCSGDSEPMRLPDQRIGGTSLRPGERELLKRYRDDDEARPHREPAAVSRKADTRARACWNRRRQLQEVRARLRSGYGPGEGRALRRKRDAYADYLRRFCS